MQGGGRRQEHFVQSDRSDAPWQTVSGLERKTPGGSSQVSCQAASIVHKVGVVDLKIMKNGGENNKSKIMGHLPDQRDRTDRLDQSAQKHVSLLLVLTMQMYHQPHAAFCKGSYPSKGKCFLSPLSFAFSVCILGPNYTNPVRVL